MTKNVKSYRKLISIAIQNEQIVRKGYYQIDGSIYSIAHLIIGSMMDSYILGGHDPQDEDLKELEEQIPTLETFQTKVEVKHQGTVAGASEMYHAYDGDIVPLLLNFASAKTPGGGYVRGTVAQEEDLCRCSSLYFCIKDKKEYYYQFDSNNYLFTDDFIYSKQVPFFRNEDYSLTKKPFVADVVTYAAPNNSKVPFDDQVLFNTFTKRIDNLLGFALKAGAKFLVLGAWGCGVFANDPDMVAKIFASFLNGKYKNLFKHVKFSVFDKTDDLKVLKAFEKHLQWRENE